MAVDKYHEYEEFEDKYYHLDDTKYQYGYKYSLYKIPFLNTKSNMDVLSSVDANTFARIDDYIYKEIEKFPEYDYNNSIAYEMLIRTTEYKQLQYWNVSLTDEEKIHSYDQLGVDWQEIYSFILKKSNSLYDKQYITKNIFDSYCDLTIRDIDNGINKLINFYINKKQIYTLVKYDKDAFGIIKDIQYEICKNINFKDITLSLSNYYIPMKPQTSDYTTYINKIFKIDNNIPLAMLEEEFLAFIEQDIPNSIKTKITFNSTRPLLRFKESPIVDIPINLNTSKEAIVELISNLKDEFDAEHVKSSINYLYHKNFKAKNWKKDAPFKITNKSMAQAFFIYDLYNDIDVAFQTKKNQLKDLRANEIAKIETDTAKEIENENQKLASLLEKRILANKENKDESIKSDKQNTKKTILKLNKAKNEKIKEIINDYKFYSLAYDTEDVLVNLVEKDNISAHMCKQYLKFMRQYIHNMQYKELIIGIKTTK